MYFPFHPIELSFFFSPRLVSNRRHIRFIGSTDPETLTAKPMYRIYWLFRPFFSHIISLKGSQDGVRISEGRANALAVLSPRLMFSAQWSCAREL